MRMNTQLLECCGVHGLSEAGYPKSVDEWMDQVSALTTLAAKKGASVQTYIVEDQPAFRYLESLGFVKLYLGENTNYFHHKIYSFTIGLQELQSKVDDWRKKKKQKKIDKKNNVFDVEEDI